MQAFLGYFALRVWRGIAVAAFLLVLVVACGPVTARTAPFPLHDTNLITGRRVRVSCDASNPGALGCGDGVRTTITIDITAAEYARWSLRWPDTDDVLHGAETLAVRVTHTGNLSPNLFVVTQDGARVGTRLAPSGLAQGTQTIYLPLTEIRDVNGNPPDYAAITELQVVFEGADMTGTIAIEDVRFITR